MQIRILIFLSLLFLTSCKKETEKEKVIAKVNDTDIYEIVNSISNSQIDSTKNNYITENYTELKNEDFLILEKLDTLFSKDNVEFIKQQNRLVAKFKLNQKLVENVAVIPYDTLKQMLGKGVQESHFWERFAEKYKAESIESIGLPLFSKDKQIAIVSKSLICASVYCLSKSIFIYRKINGKWKIVEALSIIQT